MDKKIEDIEKQVHDTIKELLLILQGLYKQSVENMRSKKELEHENKELKKQLSVLNKKDG